MPESFALSIDEIIHDVAIRRHPNARRLTLRVDPVKKIRLTVPVRCSERRMRDFVVRHIDWLKRQIVSAPVALAFAPNVEIHLRGVPHVIVHDQNLRGVEIREGHIVIGGDARHLPRRLRDALKKEARRDFEIVTARYAAQLGVHVRRISLRDTSTRWGSCNRSGTVCYSWRLIFAPSFVLDYLAAHEVAHLRHMDHSKRFWALVEEICPHTNEARAWLRKNGNALLAFG